MTGVWAYTNTLSTSSNVLHATAPQLLANGSNLMAGFQKGGVRTWNVSFDTQNFGSGSNVNALKLCSDLPCPLPIWITDFGMLNVGNVFAQQPNLSTISDTIGPAIRIYGDILLGDVRSFGSLAHTVTGATNNGSGLIRITVASTAGLSTGNVIQVGGIGGVSAATGVWTITVVDGTHLDLQGSTFSGSFTSNGWYGTGQDSTGIAWKEPGSIPSSTRVYSGADLNVDGTGGAYILLHPDSTLTPNLDEGELDIVAYGSSGAGPYVNKIRLATRSGSGTIADTAVVGSAELAMAKPLKLQAVAFASLPTCNASAQGYAVLITNSNTSTFGAAITGAGGSIGIALCDGTNWTYR